jgi:hypothetical protein
LSAAFVAGDFGAVAWILSLSLQAMSHAAARAALRLVCELFNCIKLLFTSTENESALTSHAGQLFILESHGRDTR